MQAARITDTASSDKPIDSSEMLAHSERLAALPRELGAGGDDAFSASRPAQRS